MSFVSMLRTGQLPEKPWRTGAVARLVASVIVCIFMGAAVAMLFRYFETPEKSSAIYFISLCALAITSFAGAIFLLLRPWPLEDYLSRLIGLLLCVYAGFFLMWMAGRLITGKLDLQNPIVTMLVAVLAFQGTALIFVHFFLREHGTGWAEGFDLANRPAQSLLMGVCAGVLIVFPAWVLQDLSMRLFEWFAFHPHEQEAVKILRNTQGLSERIVLGITTILIAPLGEEILFRGILYPAIKRNGHQQLALWSTALLFGAIHANLASFVPLTLLAVVLVWLYEYTGNLLTCITVHCVFNAANFVALYRFQK